MRNVLVDQARARGALKRGEGFETVSLHEEMWAVQVDLGGVVDLDEALTRLEKIDRVRAKWWSSAISAGSRWRKPQRC